MTVKEAMRRIARELEALKLSLHGHLGQLAAQRDRRRSFITRLPKARAYTFARLLEVIEICGVEPAAFFARALDIRPDPEDFLRDILRPGEECAALERIEKTTRRIEFQDPPSGEPSGARPALWELTRASRSDQRKRLRNTKKFQTEEFLREYLIYVNDLRYESPEDSAFLAETLAGEVVAKMIAPKEVRIELQCQAVGVFGSAHRKLARFTVASRSILMGLELARRHDLEEAAAELLIRGAYVLSDHGLHQRALALLESAQIIFSDLENEVGEGQALVVRGIVVGLQGRYPRSAAILKRALSKLPENDDAMDRWRLAAFHGASLAYCELGDLESAESWLNEGVETTAVQSGADLALVFWLRARVASLKGDLARAERYMLRVLRALRVRDNAIQVVFASLDLISILLKQKRLRQASSLARECAVLTSHLKGNRLAAAVVMRLSQAGLEGEVTHALVDELTQKMKKGAHRKGSTPRAELPPGFDVRTNSKGPLV